jgi:peroxiredoxin Q/BCP
MSTKTRKTARKHPASKRRPPTRRSPLSGPGARAALWIGVGLIALGAVYLLNRPSSTTNGGSGQYAFQVGAPGPGESAPPIVLESTTGEVFDLSSSSGERTLLYFQEGLTCQPCWDQLSDIERDIDRFRALGINEVVAITTDPIDALRQKTADQGLTSRVLSDPDLRVSASYQANSYGMMGTSRDGHTFIIVGPDGVIEWRADYGGPPDFTMYLPVDALVADIQAGIGGGP